MTPSAANGVTSPEPVVLSWSSGKDSAWALHILRQEPDLKVVGLLTTLNGDADRVAMHAVRRELLEQQAQETGLPLVRVDIPQDASNEVYEAAFGGGLQECARRFGAKRFAFGDLYLEDIRDYRERHLHRYGFSGLFPLWGKDTDSLAREMIDGGLRAVLTCVDTTCLPAETAGQPFDTTLLEGLPVHADPCGENGEFHTFAWDGPMFGQAIRVQPGDCVKREQFVYADMLPINGSAP